jgi:hypothetical protein
MKLLNSVTYAMDENVCNLQIPSFTSLLAWSIFVQVPIATTNFDTGQILYTYIVTCYDTNVQCLQVILTPTSRVSGYPRQVIKVETLLDDYALFSSVNNSYNAYISYTTRHL